MTEKKQHMQRHPMHLGGRRRALPPNPPPAFSFKGCLLSLPHWIPRTPRRKNTRRRQKITKKNNTCKDTQCIWGEAPRPPPQPPSSLFSLKVASSHCHIASKNITKKKHKKKKTKNNPKKQHMQRHPMRLPPNPPPAFFFLRLPPLTATLLPRTTRRKNTRRRRQK